MDEVEHAFFHLTANCRSECVSRIARFFPGDGYDPSVAESFIDRMQAGWGTGVGLSLFAPSVAREPAARAFWARCQTVAVSPGAAAAFLRALMEIDVRHVLPTIRDPTLTLHAARDLNVPIEAARSCRATFDGPARAVACAQELIAELAARGHNAGAAVHSGECLRAGGDALGVAVEIAGQLAADANPGEVMVSQTVRDLVVGSTIRLEPRDLRTFDGVPGQWEVLARRPAGSRMTAQSGAF